MKKIIYTFVAVLAICSIIALAVWLAVRVSQVRQTVHHHANIAIFIDDERLDISADKYMEDIGACKVGEQKSPRDRVHFHENNMDTVHIHDDGVTWGHLLSNLGFYFTDAMLVLDDGAEITANDEKQWYYILNGKKVTKPFNMEIRSHDRLLMSYSNGDVDSLTAQFESVSDNAEEYNNKYDPGACQVDEKQNFLVKTIVELLSSHDAHDTTSHAK